LRAVKATELNTRAIAAVRLAVNPAHRPHFDIPRISLTEDPTSRLQFQQADKRFGARDSAKSVKKV
jgi:hypothetical protein